MKQTVEYTHEVSPETLMAFVDGELAPFVFEVVEKHVASCVECQQLVDGAKKLSEELAGWSAAELPAKTEASVLAAARNSARGGSWVPQRWGKRLLMACAGMAALLVGFFVLSAPRRAMLGKHVAVDEEWGSAGSSREAMPTAPVPPTSGTAQSAASSYVQDEQARTQALMLRRQEAELSSNLEVSPPERANRIGAADDSATTVRAIQPMIARSVSLAVVTKDFAASRASLETILARHHGYAAELTVSTEQNAARSLQASLRIPAGELTAALVELKALGEVQKESQQGEEVTQQHADIVARLKNSRETEQRLQAILLQRTGKISDVLQVEQEIARVRGEIEQMEGEQKALEHRVDFATVDLSLSEEYHAALADPSPSITTRFRNAAVQGFKDALNTVVSIGLFFVGTGPVLLLWALLLALPVRFLWRRGRQRMSRVAVG